ncbi:MAG: SufD family Fe-S cluster assembly protein [archaeon]|nr:SufD family Fe-S cluster assembly protein [archaeon]
MLETIVRNLDLLKGGEITENTKIDVLLPDTVDGTHVIDYTVSDCSELDLTLFDLADGDVDLSLRVHMKKGASCRVNIASICRDGKKKIFSVDTIHVEGNTFSRTKMAGINAGEGTLRFIGTSDVRNGAHGSDTRQDGRITNLSPGSRSEVSPVLLIKDDEVDASHGAAVGAYDPNAMYYLMSRGLTEAESRRLITIGSLIPVADAFYDDGIRKEAMDALEAVIL